MSLNGKNGTVITLLALFLSLAVQISIFAFGYGKLTSQVQSLDDRVHRIEDAFDRHLKGGK